jgi:hypothetical protein
MNQPVSSLLISKVRAMAPPRKKRRAPGEGHPLHLRLPTDVFRFVEARAAEKQWPLNRAIINLLASIPHLETARTQEQVLQEMQIVLARYGSRITSADLSEPLRRAVDDVLAAHTDGEQQARLDRLRVLRSEMLNRERVAKE